MLSYLHFLDFFRLSPNTSSAIVGIIQLLAFFISLPLIDRFGRKFLLLVSAVGMTISNLLLGTYFYFAELEKSTGDLFVAENFGGWFPLTVMSVFIAAYSLGFGPVPFIIMSELFPSIARSYLCSMASFVNHFILFLVILTFPIVMEKMSPSFTFWSLGVFSLVTIPFVIFIVKETKGKTLTQIELMFDSNRTGPVETEKII